jgi:hypothetical protein
MDSGQALRMTSLFATVRLSNHHPHPDPVRQAHDTALPSRERETKDGVFRGSARNERLDFIEGKIPLLPPLIKGEDLPPPL